VPARTTWLGCEPDFFAEVAALAQNGAPDCSTLIAVSRADLPAAPGDDEPTPLWTATGASRALIAWLAEEGLLVPVSRSWHGRLPA
jgi:hypothetical protein